MKKRKEIENILSGHAYRLEQLERKVNSIPKTYSIYSTCENCGSPEEIFIEMGKRPEKYICHTCKCETNVKNRYG